MFKLTRNGETILQIDNLALKGRRSFRIKEKIKTAQEARQAILFKQVQEAGIPMDEFQKLVRDRSRKRTREDYEKERNELLVRIESGDATATGKLKKVQAEILIVDHSKELEELEIMLLERGSELSEEDKERFGAQIENYKELIQEATFESIDEKAIDFGIGIKAAITPKILEMKDSHLKLKEEVAVSLFQYFGLPMNILDEEMTLEEMEALIAQVDKENEQPDFLK